MRALKSGLPAAIAVAVLFAVSGWLFQPRAAAQSPPSAASLSSPELLRWPLAEADRVYGAIDGKHISQYVTEEAAIARRYRDRGHPQYWGRIMGTSGDAESAQWLLDKYKKIGLADAHIQPLDIAPQWVTKGGRRR